MSAKLEAKTAQVKLLIEKKYPNVIATVHYDEDDRSTVAGARDDASYDGTYSITFDGKAGQFQEYVDARLSAAQIVEQLGSYIADLDYDSAQR